MTNPRKPAPRRRARSSTDGLKKLYRRWRTGGDPPGDSLWSDILGTSSYARALPTTGQDRLRELVKRFLKTKSFEGAAGLKVSAAMRARIALHACIPILNLGLDFYIDWASVVIYPGDFRVDGEYMDEHGIVHREIMDLCGQSLSHGPVVLSWEAIREEDQTASDHNLVIHECAHKLDVLNGDANGFPPLHENMSASAWSQDFLAAYERLHSLPDTGTTGRLDPYAAEDPSEFFAVTSETFFTMPRLVSEDFPSVYRHLSHFYRQDPLRVLRGEPA